MNVPSTYTVSQTRSVYAVNINMILHFPVFVDKHMDNTSVSHREGQCVSKDAHNRCNIIQTGTLLEGGLNISGIVWLECSWKIAHKSISLIRINVTFIYKLTKVKLFLE